MSSYFCVYNVTIVLRNEGMQTVNISEKRIWHREDRLGPRLLHSDEVHKFYPLLNYEIKELEMGWGCMYCRARGGGLGTEDFSRKFR
jgi:hypothetical protein